MPLVNISDMLHHAHQHRYAVGAFDVVSLDFIEGVMAAAESLRAPVILSLAESHFEFFDFELLMAAVERAAERSTVPVAIHLDHGSSLESAVRGINQGCTGVMVDASSLPLDENIARTREVVEMARGCGVPVEGELGYVPGVEARMQHGIPGSSCMPPSRKLGGMSRRPVWTSWPSPSVPCTDACRESRSWIFSA